MRAAHWFYTVPLRLRSLLARRAVERELREELQFHLDQQIAVNIAHGMSPDAARTAALVRLGGVERRKDEVRDTRRVAPIENLLRDLRHALRVLGRRPGYTAIALITLALGLGANTAIFTVVNAVLFRPLAYHDPERLIVVSGTVAPANFLDWRAGVPAFAAAGAAEYWTPTLTGHDAPEQIQALRLTPDLLPMLGVPPLLGRLPSAEEAHDGRQRVVVLSHGTWTHRYAAARTVLGETMALNGQPYTIIGVMPSGFQFAPYWATHSEVWAPLVLEGRAADRDGQSLRLFARLAPGITIAGAQAELNAVMARLERAYPGSNTGATLVALQDMVVGDVRPALLVLLGAVGLVLLTACANVAHLQLLHAASREREFAVRVALGASRGRLVQQSLAESVLLSLGGALLGLGVAWAGVRLLILLSPPNLPRLETIHLDATVFAFLLVVALLSSLVFGVAPALRSAGVPAGGALKEGSRSGSESPRRRRIRTVLVVSEFATALVLLVGAGLLLRSFAKLAAVDMGFDPAHTLTMTVSLRGTPQAEPARRSAFFAALTEQLRTRPGVTAVGVTNHLPISGDNWRFSFSVEGRPFPRPGERPHALFRLARPGYFNAMRIPLVRGRDFLPADEANAARVVIVNETLARREFPGVDPIGRRLSVDDPLKQADWFTIVGVAHDVTQNRLASAPDAEMYYPYLRDTTIPEDAPRLTSSLHPAEMMFVIRASGDPAALMHAVQDAVHALDRGVAVSRVETMERVVAGQFTAPTFYLLLLGAFAGVAVLLAAVGVYGVLSHSAARRSHEMGVRIALGAAPAEPFRLVAREGLTLALVGGGLGVVAALGLTRYLRTLLFGVEPTDPLMFAAAVAVLVLIALLACWFPARRAARTDPMTALRGD